jgi:hypothetical protein
MTTNAEREPFVDAVAAGEFLHLRPRRVLELARLMMSSPIASGQKTKAPVTKMGLTYWFLR